MLNPLPPQQIIFSIPGQWLEWEAGLHSRFGEAGRILPSGCVPIGLSVRLPCSGFAASPSSGYLPCGNQTFPLLPLPAIVTAELFILASAARTDCQLGYSAQSHQNALDSISAWGEPHGAAQAAEDTLALNRRLRGVNDSCRWTRFTVGRTLLNQHLYGRFPPLS